MNDTINGKTRAPGAPRGNRNRERHGLRGSKLPKDCRYIELAANELRRQLEDAVGETTVYHSALINSAMRHERRAMLCERWFRLNEDLPLTEKLALLKQISDATDSRDKCISRLGINLALTDPWDAMTRNIEPPVTETGARKEATTDMENTYDNRPASD